jgi:hypothetical protein
LKPFGPSHGTIKQSSRQIVPAAGRLGPCRPPVIAHELGVVTIAAASLEPPTLPR